MDRIIFSLRESGLGQATLPFLNGLGGCVAGLAGRFVIPEEPEQKSISNKDQ